MSHLKERKEKNCLNCNAEITNRYCSICGQENVEPVETAWHLITHFFNDITHFDGKFFTTIKLLLCKPGFLPNEYKIGRRASYLNPVRLYIFTSFIFFLLLFSFFSKSESEPGIHINFGKTDEQVAAMDSIAFLNYTAAINKGKPLTRQQYQVFKDTSNSILKTKYKTVAEYDSLLQAGKIKDNFLVQKIERKAISLRSKYKGTQGEKSLWTNLKEQFRHHFPQMLIISLPLFAFFLSLLYWRHKSFNFVSHAVFSIYLYVFVFMILLIILSIQKLQDYYNGAILSDILVLLSIGIFFYQARAMRNFYQQGRGKTLLKMFLLNMWLLFITILLFAFFFLYLFIKL